MTESNSQDSRKRKPKRKETNKGKWRIYNSKYRHEKKMEEAELLEYVYVNINEKSTSIKLNHDNTVEDEVKREINSNMRNVIDAK